MEVVNIPILRSLGDNSGFARIPFAVVAVTILFLSSTLIGQVSEIYRLKQNRIIEDEIAEFKKISESESAAIEAGAYSAIQNVLPNITGTQALEYSS